MNSSFNSYLQNKIKKNMHEWKKGRWSSQKQALAVSYAQTRSHFNKIRKSRKTSKNCCNCCNCKRRKTSKTSKSRK